MGSQGTRGICSQSIRFIAVLGESASRELKTPWARGFSFLFAWRTVAEQSLASALALNICKIRFRKLGNLQCKLFQVRWMWPVLYPECLQNQRYIYVVGLSLLDVKSDPSKFIDLPNWRWLDKIVPVLYQCLPHLACTLFLGSEEKLQTNQSIFVGKTT